MGINNKLLNKIYSMQEKHHEVKCLFVPHRNFECKMLLIPSITYRYYDYWNFKSSDKALRSVTHPLKCIKYNTAKRFIESLK